MVSKRWRRGTRWSLRDGRKNYEKESEGRDFHGPWRSANGTGTQYHYRNPGHRIDDNQGIASTRTRGYRLRIAENLNHSSWLIPRTQTGGVDKNKCCHRPEVLRERPERLLLLLYYS